MMREQLGFALNREGRWEAEKILKAVIVSSARRRTNGLLSRIYKDRWEAQEGGTLEERALLKRAVGYLQGFSRIGATPIPNRAVTDGDDGQARSRAGGNSSGGTSPPRRRPRAAGFWDYATLLELAVLGRGPCAAELLLAIGGGGGIGVCRGKCCRNLRLVRETRTARGEDAGWIKPLEDALADASQRLAPPKAAG
jgi:hypothetical protein